MPTISSKAQQFKDLVVGLVRAVAGLKENDAIRQRQDASRDRQMAAQAQQIADQQRQIDGLTIEIVALSAAVLKHPKNLTRESREQGRYRSLKVVTYQTGYKSSAIWRYLRDKDKAEFGRCDWWITRDGHHVVIDTECPSFPEKAKQKLREFEAGELSRAEKEEKPAK